MKQKLKFSVMSKRRFRKKQHKFKRELDNHERSELRKLRTEAQRLKKLVDQFAKELETKGVVRSESCLYNSPPIDPRKVVENVNVQFLCEMCGKDAIVVVMEPRIFLFCHDCSWRGSTDGEV